MLWIVDAAGASLESAVEQELRSQVNGQKSANAASQHDEYAFDAAEISLEAVKQNGYATDAAKVSLETVKQNGNVLDAAEASRGR